MAAVLPAILLAACATGPRPGELTGFATAVGKVHGQTDAAFDRANAISRQAAIDLFVTSRRPGLSERSFPMAIAAQTRQAWDGALADLERYGTLLATLTGAGRGRATGEAFVGLGDELGRGQAGVGIDPGVGAGFAALAAALVDSQARSSARDVMRRTDPAVRSLVAAMAAAIGASDAEGLRGTVASNWTAALGATRAAYATAAEKGDESRQRSLIADYLAGVDRRDADLRALASLRTSLLTLGDAHAAAAAGSAPGQAAVLDGIDRRLADMRRDMGRLGEAAK